MQISGCRYFFHKVFRNAQQCSRGSIVVRARNFAGRFVHHVARVVAGRWNRNPIRPQEGPVVLKARLNTKTTLMHQRVVLRAQQHQVIERGLAVSRPMLDMMAVQEAAIVAAWKPAAVVVSRTHGTFNGSRNDP